MHQAPESHRVSAVKSNVGDCAALWHWVGETDNMGTTTTHRVTPLGGPPGPRGCPRGGGWPGWKPPSAPAGRSSLAEAPSTTCWAAEVAGGGGSEVAKVEGRLMAGPHDTIRGSATIRKIIIGNEE